MIGNKRILVVVTARKGSKGIPGKNFRDLLGKPLFMWSMLAGLNSKYVDTTVLSSNCEECENICVDWMDSLDLGEDQDKVIFWQRPDGISTDTSKNEEALIHTVMACKNGYGLDYDIVINLQPTSPCRLESLLDRCIEAYHEGGYDSLLTSTKDTPFIWQKIRGEWEYTVDKNNCCDRKMRQELDESEMVYKDNGNIYITDKNILLDRECRIGYNPCVFETKGINNIQIDEEYDFLLIEKMAEALKLGSLI